MTKLPTGRKLWREAITGYRLHFWRYALIVLVVTLPNVILTSLSNNDVTVSAYGSLASIFMNTALITAVIAKDAERRKLRSYYYDGSAAAVRYIFVGVVLALLLIPAAFGLNLVGLGGSATAVPPLGEILLLGLIGLIISIPSIYFITRFGFALLAVFDHQVWPGAALRMSWQLTQRRFWNVLGRMLALALGLGIAVLPVGLVCIGLLIITKQTIFLTLFQLINAAILLPLFYLYLTGLYSALGGPTND